MRVREQDWGLALLFSVQPTDRALAGYPCGTVAWADRLRQLAEIAAEDEAARGPRKDLRP